MLITRPNIPIGTSNSQTSPSLSTKPTHMCSLTSCTLNYSSFTTKPAPPIITNQFQFQGYFPQPPNFLYLTPPHTQFLYSFISWFVHVEMRDRMERIVLLPFSLGCVSESSVAIGVHQPRRTKPDTNSSAISLYLYLSSFFSFGSVTICFLVMYFYLIVFDSFLLGQEKKKKTRKVHQVLKVWKIHWSSLRFQSLTYPLGFIGCARVSRPSLNYLVSLKITIHFFDSS